MDTTAGLRDAADELEVIAHQLLRRPMARSRSTGEDPGRQLGRSVYLWAVAIRRLAESADIAWRTLDQDFPRDPDDDPPEPFEELPEGHAPEVSQLDAMTTFLIGDLVLEDLAWAELVRRDEEPRWRAGRDRVPGMWTKFMDIVDEGDEMCADARYLDVTLAVARDLIVAHRDPTTSTLPSWSNSGEVRLTRITLDETRKARAFRMLTKANESLEVHWPARDYDELRDRLVALAPRLDARQRAWLKASYRHAGIESPPLVDIASKTARLLKRHLARDRSVDDVPG
jgi:hypothetical protein